MSQALSEAQQPLFPRPRAATDLSRVKTPRPLANGAHSAKLPSRTRARGFVWEGRRVKGGTRRQAALQHNRWRSHKARRLVVVCACISGRDVPALIFV